jgi:hypothetical protein
MPAEHLVGKGATTWHAVVPRGIMAGSLEGWTAVRDNSRFALQGFLQCFASMMDQGSGHNQIDNTLLGSLVIRCEACTSQLAQIFRDSPSLNSTTAWQLSWIDRCLSGVVGIP